MESRSARYQGCGSAVNTQQCMLGALLVLLCSGGALAAEAFPGDARLRDYFLTKRGLGLYFDDNFAKLSISSGPTWAYDWTFGANKSVVDACVKSGMDYMPIVKYYNDVFGVGTNNLSVVFRNKTFPRNTQYLLGFNEPNSEKQANMSAAQAAAQWPLVEAAATHYNLSLVSPAPARCTSYNCAGDVPFTWWDDFFGNCTVLLNRTCRVDIMAAHYYSPCNVSAFQQYIDQITTRYNRPIMMTEFGCNETAANVHHAANFMRQTMALMDSDTRVVRYCWYSDKPRLSSAWNDTTGPGALYYDIDNSTHNSTQLTGLGRVYMEKLCPINSA